MTPENKQLLLKDLCPRLPYGVKFQGEDSKIYTLDAANYFALQIENVVFKPYLRPMSSMTDEETDRMWEIYESGPAAESSVAVAEYLYERHLDCHYMIEKGLALEAPEGMYKID